MGRGYLTDRIQLLIELGINSNQRRVLSQRILGTFLLRGVHGLLGTRDHLIERVPVSIGALGAALCLNLRSLSDFPFHLVNQRRQGRLGLGDIAAGIFHAL